jgi:hypothetical protein
VFNNRVIALIPSKWHDIRSIVDISHYSLITFKANLSKRFGYSCIFIYTTKVLKILFFGENFNEINCEEQ